MQRRYVLAAGAAMAGVLCCGSIGAFAQLLPLYLRLVRRAGWEQLMGRNQCVIGDLYVSPPNFPLSDPGRKLSNALELAYRNNQNEISSIPPGDYRGAVRTDGRWRLELAGTGERKNIQIHVGNRPRDTLGCILPGTGDSSDASCLIAGSKHAMAKLREEYGDSLVRPVVLRIE